MENKNLISALVKAQLEIRAPVKEGTNPMFKNKYATLDAIYAACRKPLADNGLSLSHSVEVDPQGRYFLVTTLFHVSGESMKNNFPMIIEKQTNQGIASARTYACRYATCNLLALPGDEDDDGNASAKEAKKTLNSDQCRAIEEYVGENKELTDRILKGYKVKTLGDIDAKNFLPIMQNLKKRVAV
jgi:hypothetical protein